MLIEKKHKNSKDIQDSLGKLLVLWRNLLQETNEKGRGLEEAQDILEFNNQVDKVETWIRDKVKYINTVNLYYRKVQSWDKNYEILL